MICCALCHCCSLILLPSSETLPIGPHSCSRAASACVPWGLSSPFPPSIRDSLQNQEQDDFKTLLIVDDNFILLFLRQRLLSAELSQLTRPKSSKTFWCQKKRMQSTLVEESIIKCLKCNHVQNHSMNAYNNNMLSQWMLDLSKAGPTAKRLQAKHAPK